VRIFVFFQKNDAGPFFVESRALMELRDKYGIVR
jgi:hypothetical protein